MTIPSWESKTEAVLQQAFEDGRSHLFEHETYRILQFLDFRVPVYTVIRDCTEITCETMRHFSSNRIVCKAISRKLLHKTAAGGVKIVHKDIDLVSCTCGMMLDTFTAGGTPLEGILLVEYIDYSQSLGNEILLGFRESETFGTVISFSKGGDDADHFAANFSSPNLIFPPINRKWATALQQSTKIYSRYLEEHRSNFINHIVDAEMKFSRLATRFSNYFDSPSGFAITEFEVNPFIFTADNRFVALDGWAAISPKRPAPAIAVKAGPDLAGFFMPNSIAVIGVSTRDPSKPANTILRNLMDSGHKSVYGINTHGGTITVLEQQVHLYQHIGEIGHPVELAVICIPAEASGNAVEQCAAHGVRAIILIPGGFSETNGDRSIEERILSIARRNGIRILGPNCLGIITDGTEQHPALNTFFLSRDKFQVPSHARRNVALISQSGACSISMVNRLRHAVAPGIIVSYGNQIDVDAVDLINYVSGCAAIDVIGLYCEGLQTDSGRNFFNAIARSKKRIIVYKAGRTAAGSRAVASHTASVAGEYDVARAAVKQAGGIVADTMEVFSNFIKSFSLLHGCTVRGTNIGVIANAGYEKAAAADNLHNLTPATLSETTSRSLRTVLPSFVNIEPLLDVTPMVSDDQFARTVAILLAAPEIDALCISIIPQAEGIHTTDDEIARCNDNLISRLVTIAGVHKKPLVMSIDLLPGSGTCYNRMVEILESGGIPTFFTARQAMESLNEFIHFNLTKKKNILSEWLK
jgi:acyl-CoA synthetase (NDP forming)